MKCRCRFGWNVVVVFFFFFSNLQWLWLFVRFNCFACLLVAAHHRAIVRRTHTQIHFELCRETWFDFRGYFTALNCKLIKFCCLRCTYFILCGDSRDKSFDSILCACLHKTSTWQRRKLFIFVLVTSASIDRNFQLLHNEMQKTK